MGECSWLLNMAITALGYRLLKFLHCTCSLFEKFRVSVSKSVHWFWWVWHCPKKTYVMLCCLYEKVGFHLGISSKFFHFLEGWKVTFSRTIICNLRSILIINVKTSSEFFRSCKLHDLVLLVFIKLSINFTMVILLCSFFVWLIK